MTAKIHLNCNDCFGNFDNAISQVTIDDGRDRTTFEGSTLSIDKSALTSKLKVLYLRDASGTLCDRKAADYFRLVYLSEELDTRNFFWSTYEVTKTDAAALSLWLGDRWVVVKSEASAQSAV